MNSLCVFCGCNEGKNPAYRESAVQMAQELYRREIQLVYGGGNCGLMGILANALLNLGGRVTGVIPEALWTLEVGHKGLTEMKVVKSMHERKALMSNLADGFIALPGGFGTFEELFEVITWAQLGFHSKPVGILNVDHYFDPLLNLIAHAVEEGFIPDGQELILSAPDPAELVAHMIGYHPVESSPKWIDQGEI
jgi:uncharacterized protein (TIGR00730 family)